MLDVERVTCHLLHSSYFQPALNLIRCVFKDRCAHVVALKSHPGALDLIKASYTVRLLSLLREVWGINYFYCQSVTMVIRSIYVSDFLKSS